MAQNKENGIKYKEAVKKKLKRERNEKVTLIASWRGPFLRRREACTSD